MTSIDGDFFPFSSSERYDFDIPRRFANTFCLTSWKTRIRRSASDNITTNIPLGHGKYLSFDKMESDLAPEHLFQRPQQPQHAIDVGHYEENSPKQTGLTRPSRPFIPVLRSLPPLLGSYGSRHFDFLLYGSSAELRNEVIFHRGRNAATKSTLSKTRFVIIGSCFTR